MNYHETYPSLVDGFDFDEHNVRMFTGKVALLTVYDETERPAQLAADKI